MKFKEKFRAKLKELRESKNIKIRELARKSGVSVSYISMIENGLLTNDPSEDIINKLEDGLAIDKGTLLSYSTTASTVAIKKLNSDPVTSEKVRIILDAATDEKKLDKMLKAIDS